MIAALRYEVVRLRTLRSTWWLLGSSLAVSIGIAVLLASLIDAPQGWLIPALTGFSNLAVPVCGILMGLVGAFAIGHEYRYGTIRVTLPVVPRRGPLLLAKLVVVAGWSIVVAALNLLASWLVVRWWPGSHLLDDQVSDGTVARVLTGFVVLVLLYAVVGLALAGLLRNLPGAIVLLVVWPLVVEPILGGLTNIPALNGLQDDVKYLPFAAGQRLVSAALPGGGPQTQLAVLGPWQGGAVFGGLAVVLLIAWAATFARRDA